MQPTKLTECLANRLKNVNHKNKNDGEGNHYGTMYMHYFLIHDLSWFVTGATRRVQLLE